MQSKNFKNMGFHYNTQVLVAISLLFLNSKTLTELLFYLKMSSI